MCSCVELAVSFFFFNDTATTEIYTLSLHDALPISPRRPSTAAASRGGSCSPAPTPTTSTGRWPRRGAPACWAAGGDRESTRLNSSHANIPYAVFCFKKKNIPKLDITVTDHIIDDQP